MLVFVPQKILSLLGLLGQNIMLLCHYAERKRIMDSQLSIFVFFFLCSVSLSIVCLYRVHNLFFFVFGEFQAPPIALEYSVFSLFQWIHLDANILEMMPRKMGNKRLFWYVWT